MATLPADRTKLALAQGNQVPSAVIASAKNINAITEIYDTTDQLYAYVNQSLAGIYDTDRYGRLGIINVLDAPYSAVGDGATDDTAAIQAAITACPTGGIVYFPSASVYYKVTGNLQLKGNITLMGAGKYANGIHGTGVAPIFLTGIYPAGNLNNNRGITVCHLNVQNTNYPITEWYTAVNFNIYQCYFLTSNSDCLKIRYSFRGYVKNCDIQTSGLTYFAISAFDNCNGVYITENNISGGTVGGAVDIANSQGVAVKHNIIETGYYGIRVADSQGNVNGFQVINNYLEQVRDPIVIGRTTTAQAGTISDNFINNTSYPSSPTFGILLGRAQSIKVQNNEYLGKSVEPFIMFATNAGSGINYLKNSVIRDNLTEAILSNYGYDASITNMAIMETIFSSNYIKFLDGLETGVTRVFVSPTLTSNVGAIDKLLISSVTEGGIVDKVEIIDALGTLDCSVKVGNTVNTAENVANVAITGLTYTYNAATMTLANGRLRRGAPVLYTVAAGVATGTFRIRITYRN